MATNRTSKLNKIPELYSDFEATAFGGRIKTNHWRTEGGVGGFKPPPRNSEGPPKSCQTQPDCENC